MEYVESTGTSILGLGFDLKLEVYCEMVLLSSTLRAGHVIRTMEWFSSNLGGCRLGIQNYAQPMSFSIILLPIWPSNLIRAAIAALRTEGPAPDISTNFEFTDYELEIPRHLHS